VATPRAAWSTHLRTQLLSRCTSLVTTGHSGGWSTHAFEHLFEHFPGGTPLDYWQEAWADEFLKSPSQLLVLNRGAHYVLDAVYVAELNETLAAVRAAKPNCIVVFRTTVPGTANCNSYMNHVPLADASSLPPRETWPYFWDKFEGQNALARALIQRHHPHVLVLDPVAPLLLRPDTHLGGEDCLHYKMPGPIDMWDVALVETLELLLHDA
jgi:hypothetical protein